MTLSDRSIKERVAAVSLANDAGKLAEALRIAVAALSHYADQGAHGERARSAVKDIERELERPVSRVLERLSKEDSCP